jgi:sugar fermentation stimulation protein A
VHFPRPLVPAVLLRRYKRFLADVRLPDGREATAHCANPGAMLGLAEPGADIWLLPSIDSRRKLAWSWELVRVGDHLVGINTGHPNALAADAIAAGRIPALMGYAGLRAGHRAVMLYVVQREDCQAFRIARDLDPAYAKAFDKARAAGVEVLCYACRMTLDGIEIGAAIELVA